MENLFDETEFTTEIAPAVYARKTSDIVTIQAIICVVVAIIFFVARLFYSSYTDGIAEKFCENVCCEEEIGEIGVMNESETE